jgi:23S rRNA pseudouridine2604 synthase
MSNSNSELFRLNKAISDTGFCSRREADKLIEQGRVTINGRIGILGEKVSDKDIIAVDGLALAVKEIPVYIVFNKPIGIICTTDKNTSNNIIDFIKHPKRIFPIGRLDKASEGLIFLTSDGNIVNKILRAGNNHEKEYLVTVNKNITNTFISEMSNGIPILNTITKKCKVEKVNDFVFRIILTQGLNRQIRRMCTYMDYEVKKLQRIRIMNISLDGLAIGSWRNMTEEELEFIMQAVSQSIKTEEASYIVNEDDDLE